MIKWQYKILTGRFTLSGSLDVDGYQHPVEEEDLNREGADGWEAVSVRYQKNGGDVEIEQVLLKRPTEDSLTERPRLAR